MLSKFYCRFKYSTGRVELGNAQLPVNASPIRVAICLPAIFDLPAQKCTALELTWQ
jgi:hypothetical protein